MEWRPSKLLKGLEDLEVGEEWRQSKLLKALEDLEVGVETIQTIKGTGGLGGWRRVETIQTTALSRTARILKRVLEI